MDIKTSSADTQSLRIQMPECVNTAENDFVLATSTFSQVPVPVPAVQVPVYLAYKYKYKYQYPKIVLKYRSSTSTGTQYNKTGGKRASNVM